MKDIIYDHYIAIDWSAINMAIARMTKKSNKITAVDVPSDIKELQFYLKKLKGTKILSIEETTTSQWLYTELKESVDEVLICDPYRNSLLSEGPKTDKIDATKLVQLLKAGVRTKNQRYSLLRVCGKTGNEGKGFKLDSREDQFVLEGLDRQIQNYNAEKKSYTKEFQRLANKYPEIRHQKAIPGIGPIGNVGVYKSPFSHTTICGARAFS